ncbi:dephospho-CoA kinase [uncultured Alistipes sp.]|uniref:dephospho-CoA kinase n=1 Tax=uncultured Alistipes sp. TaxID=538949 RepID=UPI00261BF98A|nr:dephospho-CoA kinase [uncultured Alistipes sp.]
MIKVGITGGIGSGKSTVCRLFAACGAAVYDTDREAKRLMNDDPDLRVRIIAAFGGECYTAEGLNRPRLAQEVFGHPERLRRLNAIVHPAVIADFRAWAGRQSGDYVVLESAILFSSGLDREVDRTVAVLAPESLRIGRTCRRDGVDEAAVRSRMAAQESDDFLRERADYCLVNIVEADTQAAVEQLDKLFRHESRNS